MKFFIKFRNLTLALAFLFGTESLAASIIVNGSFEIGTPDPELDPVEDRFTNCDAVRCSIDGWAITSQIDYMGTRWSASDGVRSIDLDGRMGFQGAMSQTFATIAGQQYIVAFDMAGNPSQDFGPVIKPMRVSSDSQSADFFFDITGRSFTDMGWTRNEWSFIADDDFATLTFQSLTLATGLSGWGPALDNVSVNAVPIPAAAWLFGSGLLGLVGMARRKKV